MQQPTSCRKVPENLARIRKAATEVLKNDHAVWCQGGEQQAAKKCPQIPMDKIQTPQESSTVTQHCTETAKKY